MVWNLEFQLTVQAVVLAGLGVESDHLESHHFDYSGLVLFNSIAATFPGSAYQNM
jgi:hypothetical protein